MKIINNQHVTLHKEAAEVLEQAERAGWQTAHLWTNSGPDKPQYYRWPNIGLWFEDLHIVVSPQPNYVTQTIFGYADIQYNHPIVSPQTVKQLIALIEVPPKSETCCLCPADSPHPATILAGDLELCDDCCNAIVELWPGVDDEAATALGELSY